MRMPAPAGIVRCTHVLMIAKTHYRHRRIFRGLTPSYAPAKVFVPPCAAEPSLRRPQPLR
jgi:hypothetical protein